MSQGEDKVGLFSPGALVSIHHGNAVKQVPRVDHQGRQCCSQKSGTAGEKADSHILHRSGIDEQAHGSGPKHTVAVAVQQDAKAESEENISGHDRNGIQESGANGGFFHRDPFLRRLPPGSRYEKL